MEVIADEMARMVKYLVRGSTVTEETLAVDAIRDIAHKGDFLSHEHTARMFRQQLYFPRLFRRQTIQQWQAAGGHSMLEVAHERVATLLDTAEPIVLPAGADTQMQHILDQAIRDIDDGLVQ